jgi:hypothetical protein
MTNAPSQYAPNDAALEEAKLKALQQSISQLQADHAQQSAQRRAQYAEDARIQDRFRDLMFGHLRSKEAELKQLAEDRRRLIEGRPKLVRRPLLTKGLPIEPSSATPNAFGRPPPYDFTWTSGSGQGTETASTDGPIDLYTQSLGWGEQSVGAGIGFWFPSREGGARRLGTSISFSYNWSEGAQAYVGDNHGRVWLTVWGMAENGWVGTSGDQSPSWTDHVGWYESHHDRRDGQASQELVFNARPNSLYACWLNTSLRCYADHGFLGFADSTAQLNINLALVWAT